MESKDYGLIYVLSNERMPNLVKIGKTTRTDLRKRMRELYSTGVPAPFKAEASCKVPLEKLSKVEDALHKAFGKFHIGTHEFFEISPDDVKPILATLEDAYGGVDAKEEVQKEIDIVNEEDIKRYRRKNMDFLAMGLPVGTVLYFKNDTSIICKIASHNRVDYQDRHGISLSALTKELLGTPYGVQPSPYWQTENGRLLIDIYKEYTRAHIADAQAQGKAAANTAKETADVLKATASKCQQLINDINHG